MNQKEILDMLKNKGMKITPQRIEIVKTLLELRDHHPSLKELYEEVKKKVPTISFSTLYSTIKKLEELGLVKLFDLLGETRIELNKKPHVNLIYIDKGLITDVVDDNLLDLLRKKLGVGEDSFVLVNVLVYNTRNGDKYRGSRATRR